ncbi:isatin hydrolase-like [Mytilus trossulus]|uniref:isatin hydrolase-like n=1 Tax=Mytilus trossulus TaxID=6551 RepID=UPI00300654C4
MRCTTKIVLLLSFVNEIFATQGSSCSDIRVVDLSRVHGPKPITAPFFPQYNFTIVNRSYSPVLGGNWFEVNYIGTSEHSGTHIDAPSHFYRGKLRMHQIPLERLYGAGVIIDVKNQVSRNHGYKVSISDIRRWETYHGRIPNGAIVLMNSGWYRRYPDPFKVFDTNNISDFTSYRFPSFNALKFLANQRSVHAVGSDSPYIYTSPSSPPEFSGFVVLFKRNIPVVLSVANVDKLPSSGSTVFLPAINIYDGSGAPVRIFATVPVSKMRY